MEIWYGLDNAPEDLGDTVVTIGVFDGIHLGHKRLIAAAVSDARARGVKSLLMTFDPNPVALFAPDKVPPALSTVSRRAEGDSFLTPISKELIIAEDSAPKVVSTNRTFISK